jgi:hypothetical protein
MPNPNGRQVAELLKQGQVHLSDDGRNMVDADGRVVARRISSEDGIGHFKAVADAEQMKAECVEVCVGWEFNEQLKVKVCVEWDCKEK